MVKLSIDPISKKILSYTEVSSTTPLYSTDILVREEELKDISFDKMSLFTKNGVEQISAETEDEIDMLYRRFFEISNMKDSEYFFKLMVDDELDLPEAKKRVKQRQEEQKSLFAEIKEKQEKHEQEVREYYISQSKQLDSRLNCKYYSAVILLIKDENKYLQEWLDWHLAVGFDHIYIYDNGVKENVLEVLDAGQKDMMAEKITVIDWSGHHENLQQDAYNHFLENFRQDVRWGLFIDSDEFLRFTDAEIANVNEFLKNYEDYTEIHGFFVEYNANGQENYTDLPVRERFTETTEVAKGVYYKNFIQVNRIDKFTRHYAYCDREKHFTFKNDKQNADLFVIDHYYTKSWEEWREKIVERGSSDPTYLKRLSEFFVYNPEMKYLDNGEEIVQEYEKERKEQYF